MVYIVIGDLKTVSKESCSQFVFKVTLELAPASFYHYAIYLQ